MATHNTFHLFILQQITSHIRNNEFERKHTILGPSILKLIWKISKIKRSVNKKDTYTFYIFARGDLRSIIREIIEGKIVVDDASRIMIKF